jgi:hypothetical protein
LKETARHQYVSGFFFAEAYVGLGQKDQAITWLERAHEEHDQWMVYIAPIKVPRRDRERFRRGPEKSYAGQDNETVGELL